MGTIYLNGINFREIAIRENELSKYRKFCQKVKKTAN